jgi:hypothetical protein
MKKRRGSIERYVGLKHWLIDSPAWHSLPCNAQAPIGPSDFVGALARSWWSMSELPPDEPSIAAARADRGGRKAAAQEAHRAQSFAVTSARAATPVADMVEAMLSGGAAAAGAQTVNQNSTLVDHYSEPNPSQNRAVARAAACNAAGAP